MNSVEEVLKFEHGAKFEGIFAVVNVSLKPFKEKEGNYLSFLLQDKTGRISSKLWDNIEHLSTIFKENNVVNITGKIEQFNKRNQAMIDEFELVTDYDESNFLIASKQKPSEMLHELKMILFSELSSDLTVFLDENYFSDEDFVEQFCKCPGGKGEVHHSYLHGLLEHTLNVVKLCEHYSQQYEHVDREILKIGAFLHDIGKIYAYTYKMSINTTDVGKLHGHTVLGYFDFITKMNDSKINEEDKSKYKLLLGHLILSHHGKVEYQAAVNTQTLEAFLLHKADSADADVNYISGLTDTSEEDWTSYSHLKGCSFYSKKKKVVNVEKKTRKKINKE